MQNEKLFNVNYFVGAMLVQTGVLQISGTHIIFKPTGMIEKMMGATEVVIALADIVAFDYTGGLARTVRIKTQNKVHKFEGSATSSFGDVLLNLLPNKAVKKPSIIQSLHPFIGPKYSCKQCTFVSQPGLRFCPKCGVAPQGACAKCQRLLDSNWNFCGHCGTKVASVSSSSYQQHRAA